MDTLCDLEKIARFFSGRWVEIVVGPETQTCRIHARALSESDSPSLRALVSERWDPANTKVINWSHTDAATAERFLTYLYTGNYHIPDPEPILTTKGTSSVPDPVADGEVPCKPQVVLSLDTVPEDGGLPVNDGSLGFGSEFNTDLGEQRALIESLGIRPLTSLDACVTLPSVENSSKDQPGNILNRFTFPHKDYSYIKPVLAIARLYCFATYHMSPNLQRSALSRLSDIIIQMDPTQPHAASELAQLTQIVYDNTTSVLTNADGMRHLISKFVATNYTSIMHDELEHVFVQGGDFALDVARKLRTSLSAQQKLQSENSEKLGQAQAKLNKQLAATASCKRCRRGSFWES